MPDELNTPLFEALPPADLPDDLPPLDLPPEGDAPPSVAVADWQVAQLRVPPHSLEAESSVLGGLPLDNGT